MLVAILGPVERKAKQPSSQNTQQECAGHRISSLELSLLYWNPRNPPLSPSFSQRCGDALASCYSNKMSTISISFFFQKRFLWGHSCRVSSPWPISPVTSWEHKTEQALSAHGHEAKIKERDMGPTMAFKSP